MRLRVSSRTGSLPFKTRETVATDTDAARATSRMVTANVTKTTGKVLV